MKTWLAVGLLFGLFCMAACDGMEGRKQKYMEQAQQDFEREDWEKSRVGYKNVLQIDPNDIAARMGFAGTLEKLTDWRGAARQYKKIIEDEPTNLQAKIRLGQIYLLGRGADEALALAEEVLASDSLNDDGLTLKAGALLQKEQKDAALILAEQALKLNQDNVDTTILLASLYSVVGRQEDAIALLENQVKRIPGKTTFHNILASLYQSQGKLVLAEQEYLKLVDLNPDDLIFKNQLIRFYESQGRREDATAVIQSVLKNEPSNVAAIATYIRLLRSREQADLAESELKRYIELNPEEYDLQFELVGFFISINQLDDAHRWLNKMAEVEGATGIKARTGISQLLVNEDDLDGALSLLNDVLQENPGDIEAMKIRGAIALKQNRPVDAVADLRAVLNANPDDARVAKALAQAHLQNDEKLLALDIYRSYARMLPDDQQLRFSMAKLYEETGKNSDAIKEYTGLLQRSPDNGLVMEKLIRVYLAENRWLEGEAIAQQLLDLNPQSPLGYYFIGLSKQKSGDFESSLAFFDKAVAYSEASIEPLTAKVRSYVALEKQDQAQQWLTQIIADNPQHYIAKNLLGELQLASQAYAKSEESFRNIIAAKPEWWVPHRNMGLLLAKTKGNAARADYLKSAIETTKGQPTLRLELAQLAEAEGDHKEAIAQYEALYAINPDNNVVVNNLAMLLVTYGKDDQSLQRAGQLVQKIANHDNPKLKDTAAWVYYNLGDYQQAKPMLEQALKSAPDEAVIQFHMAMTFHKLNEKDNAIAYMEKALSSGRPFPGRTEAEKALKDWKS
jgi:tetratricopeptide (TPR) repeat protein